MGLGKIAKLINAGKIDSSELITMKTLKVCILIIIMRCLSVDFLSTSLFTCNVLFLFSFDNRRREQ